MKNKNAQYAIVETVGDFFYQDSINGQEIHYNRPTVVQVTAFVETLISSGKIKLLKGELPSTVEDSVFYDVYVKADRNKKAALAEFLKETTKQEAADLAKEEADKKAAEEAELALLIAKEEADKKAAEEAQKPNTLLGGIFNKNKQS